MSLKPYRWLAHYYDQLFTPFRSPIEAAHNRLLNPLLPQIKNACDLACGTGTTALTFARMGIAVYAIDLSPIMCRTVRQKAARAHLPITSLRADMRAFRLPEQVDLITCEYDALNHVPHRADLRKVVKCVARALRVGGYFYFDVNNSVAFKRYWLGTVWLEKPGVVSVMRNGHNHEADRAWSDIEWFIRKGKYWIRHHERVEEVCWSGDEIRQTLRNLGLEKIRAWDAAPFWQDLRLSPGCRTIYLARKAGD